MRSYQRYMVRVMKEKFAGKKRIDFAEIGVKESETSEALLIEMPNLHATLVDPWREYDPSHPAHAEFGDRIIPQERWDEWYAEACGRMKPFGSRVRIIRATTDEAVRRIANESFDVCFLDSDHWQCSHEFRLWWPKLRVGGTIIFHDKSHQRNRMGRWDVAESLENFSRIYGEPELGEFGCGRFDKRPDSPQKIDCYLSGPLAGHPVRELDPPASRFWQKKPASP